MADDDAPEPPDEPQHAVPGEDAQEIAGSAEDAALEAAQEAQESGGTQPPEPAAAEPGGEGHAAPSAEAQEVAGSAEDAPLEAAQEAEDQAAQAAASDEGSEDADEQAAEAPTAAKPAVPGAHLEVDIVPEGADPLG